MRRVVAVFVLIFLCVFVAPVLVSAGLYARRGAGVEWRSADRSTAGLLPAVADHPGAAVRVFSARTVSWRGIVATHSWIVVKAADARAYTRFDCTAWGDPISIDRFVADGLWFGSRPEIVFAADGEAAAAIIPYIRAAIAQYRFVNPGDYRAWPGPNSNTFVAAVMSAVPGLQASLPPTAIGKDYPYDGRSIGVTPSRTGIRLNLGGYFGLTIGWVEGVEINLLGAVAGFDIRHPAIKLPALGRLGA